GRHRWGFCHRRSLRGTPTGAARGDPAKRPCGRIRTHRTRWPVRPDRMTSPVRLGAVSYLNARPLVYGLERSSEFEIRFDVPSRCADLLHAGAIDVGLIPSIEYLRRPAGT